MTLGKLEKLIERDDIPKDAKAIIRNELSAQKALIKSRSEDFELLKKAENRYRTLMEDSIQAYTVIQNGTIIDANPAAEKLLGYTKEELLSFSAKEFSRLIHPDDRKLVLTRIQNRLNGKPSPSRYECRLIDKNGAIHLVDLLSSSIEINGKPAIQTNSIDITQKKKTEDELIGEKEFIENALNALEDTFFVFDVNNGQPIRWNKAFSKISGYNDEEIRSMTPVDFFEGEDLKNMENITEKVLKEGSGFLRATFTAKTGKRIPYEYIGVLLTDSIKKTTYICAIGRNISERRFMEEKIKKSKAKYSSILRAAPIGIGVLYDRTFKYVSDFFLNIIGYSREELIGQTTQMLYLTKKEYERVGKKIYQDMEEFGVGAYEFQSKRKDNQIIDVHVRVTPTDLLDPSAGVTFTILDITKQKKVEERYRELFNNMKSGVAVYEAIDGGKDFVFKDFNQAGERIDNISKEELIGKRVLKKFPSVKEFGLFDVFQRVWKTGIAEHHPISLYEDQRVTGWRENYVYKLPSGEIVAVYNDITKRKQAEEELIKTKARLEFLLTSSPAAIYSAEPEDVFRIKFVSKNIKEITGYDSQEFINDPKFIDNLIHPEDVERVVVKLNEISGEEIHQDIYRFKHQDGSYRCILEEAKQIFDEQGRVIDRIGYLTDITKHMQTEEALRESERKYRLLFESAPIGIGISDREGRVIAFNKKILEITGYKADEIKKIKLSDTYVNPDDRKRLIKNIQDTGKVSDYSVQLKRKDGTHYYSLLNLNVMKLEGKEVFLTTQRDLTEQKKAEEALRLSEEKYRLIVETAQEGIWLIDNKAKITFANQRLAKMLGYSIDNLIGHSIFEFLDPEMKSKAELYLKLDKVGLKEKFDFKFYKRDGMEFWGLVSTNPILDPSGDIISSLGMVIDITERKKREEETKKRLMKFNVEEGNLYLIAESSPNFSITVLEDLFKFGYPGLIISRTLERDIRKIVSGEYEFLWFAQESNEKSILPKFDEIEFKIKNLKSKSVILIDRIDYLVQKSGFKDVINFIYNLKEIVYFLDSIVLISVDPKSLTDHEFVLLQKETKEIQSRFITDISEENLQILRIIYKKNNIGIKPSYSEIGNELKISRPTTRKKIKTLATAGYINEQRFGNRKILDLTQRGRNLFD